MTDLADRAFSWRLDCLQAGVQQRIHLARALRAEGHGMANVAACHLRSAHKYAAAPALCLFLAGAVR